MLHFNPSKTGWHPVRVIDLHATEQGPGTCDRCRCCNLRFLHVVEHEDGRVLIVGRECAKRLCYGYEAEREESRLRNLWERRSRWLTRNWATSWKGYDTLKLSHAGKSIRVTVFPNGSGVYRYSIAAGDERPVFSSKSFTTSDGAKLAAFDRLAKLAGW